MKALLPPASPSPSSSSSSEVVLEKCQICFQVGHDFHFGAFTCRACAAFFRRCHFSPNPDPKCKFLSEKCEPSEDGRWSCKSCRLKKCRGLGMTPTNIQYDRDAFKSSVSFVKSRSALNNIHDRIGVPITFEKALGVPHLITFLGTRERGNKEVACVDISGLIERAVLEFSKPNEIKRRKKSSNLLQLAQGLEDYHGSQNEFLTEIRCVSQEQQSLEWETNMLEAAKWMNYSDAIRQLDRDAKLDLLRNVWMVWSRLERIAMTAKMRVNGQCGKRQFVISNGFLIDYDRLSTDISWWSAYSFEELSFFFKPSEVYYDEIVDEIIEVQPDNVELTFLMSVICFHLTRIRFKESEEQIDGLQEILSNDLHEYYIRKNKTMYSLRLKQLMRIKERFLELCRKRYEKYTLGGCFDLLHLQFSDPEFFRIPC